MSTPTTNYICLNGSGIYQDLSGIFQQYTSGTPADETGFKLSNNEDLNTIFAFDYLSMISEITLEQNERIRKQNRG